VKEEMRRGMAIEFGLKRVEITIKAGSVRPAMKADPVFVGRVALWHPLSFGDAQ
jgi:hypothetical protein